MIEAIFLSAVEIANRPMEGAAYDNVVDAAQTNDTDILGDPGDDGAGGALANALLYVRTGDTDYYDAAVDLILAADGTECGHASSPVRVHALKLGPLVEAANLIGYRAAWFDNFLIDLLDDDCGESRTLIEVMEQRPNNWGTTATASVMTIARYLDDETLFEHSVDVLHGWLGNRDVYAGFDYGDLCWQADPDSPVGVNPVDAVVDGVDVDGVLPDDQRRTGDCPPDPVACENYILSAFAGPVVSAEIAHKAGSPAWQWQDNAMRRAAMSIENDGCGFIDDPAHNDRWQGWLINWQYGVGTVETADESSLSKSYNFTSWTHPTCRYDYDSDGVVGINDFLLMIEPQHFNNINDFLDLLAQWGNCV